MYQLHQAAFHEHSTMPLTRVLRVDAGCCLGAQRFCQPESRSLFNFVQFSSVAQSRPTFCNPMDCSTPRFRVHHQLPELAQTHVHRAGDAIQPPHPLSSPSPPALNLSQHQGLFQWVSSSHQVAKVLEFQLQLGSTGLRYHQVSIPHSHEPSPTISWVVFPPKVSSRPVQLLTPNPKTTPRGLG